MTYRSAYRRAAREALRIDARTMGLTQMSAWAGGIDQETLPVVGVVTPQEQSQPSTHGSNERRTLLQVVVKRLGSDDIEDVLDQDAAAVESIIVAAIQTQEIQCLLEDVSVVVNGEGESKVGTMIANFRVTSWRSPGV